MPTPTILVSDDEPLLVNALRREARRMGIAVLIDTNSNVVELAERHQPNLIVLDLHQALDGRDLLAALKRNPMTRDIPVVMLSASDDQYIRRCCLDLGAEDYEVKPFDPGFLRKMARLAGHDDAQPTMH